MFFDKKIRYDPTKLEFTKTIRAYRMPDGTVLYKPKPLKNCLFFLVKSTCEKKCFVPTETNFKQPTEDIKMKKLTLFQPEKDTQENLKAFIEEGIRNEKLWWESFERRVKKMKEDGTTPKCGFSFIPFGD